MLPYFPDLLLPYYIIRPTFISSDFKQKAVSVNFLSLPATCLPSLSFSGGPPNAIFEHPAKSPMF